MSSGWTSTPSQGSPGRRSATWPRWSTRCSSTTGWWGGPRRGVPGYPHLVADRAPLDFTEVRRAALAFAREVERRAPPWRPASGGRRSAMGCSSTSTRTPKIETVASAYSVRPTRCPGLDAGHLGGARDVQPGRLHPGDRSATVRGAGRSQRGDRQSPPDGHPRPVARALCPSGGRGGEGRSLAADVRQDAGRASAGSALEAPEGPAQGARRVEMRLSAAGSRRFAAARTPGSPPAGRIGSPSAPCPVATA